MKFLNNKVASTVLAVVVAGAVTFSAAPAFAETAPAVETAATPTAEPAVVTEVPVSFSLNSGGATANVPADYTVTVPYSYTLNGVIISDVMNVTRSGAATLNVPEGASLTVSSPTVPAVQGTFIDSYFSLNGSAASSNAYVVSSTNAYAYRVLLDFISDGTAPSTAPATPTENSFAPSSENLITASATTVKAGDTVTLTASNAVFPGDNVAVWLFSTPQLLSGWVATTSGNTTSVTIPVGTVDGQHRLLLADTQNNTLGWVSIMVTSDAVVTPPVAEAPVVAPPVTEAPVTATPVAAVNANQNNAADRTNVSARGELAETGVNDSNLLFNSGMALLLLFAGAGAMVFSRMRSSNV